MQMFEIMCRLRFKPCPFQCVWLWGAHLLRSPSGHRLPYRCGPYKAPFKLTLFTSSGLLRTVRVPDNVLTLHALLYWQFVLIIASSFVYIAITHIASYLSGWLGYHSCCFPSHGMMVTIGLCDRLDLSGWGLRLKLQHVNWSKTEINTSWTINLKW